MLNPLAMAPAAHLPPSHCLTRLDRALLCSPLPSFPPAPPPRTGCLSFRTSRTWPFLAKLPLPYPAGVAGPHSASPNPKSAPHTNRTPTNRGTHNPPAHPPRLPPTTCLTHVIVNSLLPQGRARRPSACRFPTSLCHFAVTPPPFALLPYRCSRRWRPTPTAGGPLRTPASGLLTCT